MRIIDITTEAGSTNIFSITRQRKTTLALPGEMDIVFAMISINSRPACTGIRFLKIAADCGNFDDYWDRSLFGMCRHYDTIIIEILYIRIMLG